MKNFNFNSVERAALATWRTALSGEAATKWFAALLTLSLAFGSSGCSRSKANNQSAISGQQNPVQTTSSDSGDVQARTATPVQGTIKPIDVAKKKSVLGPVHKLPATLSYTDGSSGISLKYPSRSTLETGDKAGQDEVAQERLPMNFVQPGGSTVLVLELPESSKKGAKPSSFFAVNVNKHLNAEQCGLFSTQQKAENDTEPDDEQSPYLTAVSMLTLSGVEYSEFDGDNGTKYYHRFVSGPTPQESACYEFGLAVNTVEGKQDGDKNAKSDSQQKDGFAKLEKILASVEIKTAKKPEVLETAKGTPNTVEQ